MPKGVVKNPKFQEYQKDPKIRQWLDTLNKNTRVAYSWHLFVLCDALGVSGSELLTQHRKKPKVLYPKIIGYFSNSGKSVQTRNTIRAAYVNFLETFDEEVPRVIAKRLKKLLKKPKAISHPLIPWDEAQRIITLADPKYQPVYKLMAWGLDAERFTIVNDSANIIKEVKKQLDDPTKDFVRIPIGSRKTNPSAFYVMVPRAIAAYLPVLDNDSKPIKSKFNIWHGWRMAIKRAGLTVDRSHGAHNLRATWLTEATRRGLDQILGKFQLGHTVDDMNYQRIMQDDKWVLEQFIKAWGVQPLATREDLATIEEQNKTLTEEAERVKQENELLKTTIIEVLNAQRDQTENRYNRLLRVRAKELGLSVEGDLPERLMTPAMKELLTELERLTKQLTNLGAIKKVDRVATA